MKFSIRLAFSFLAFSFFLVPVTFGQTVPFSTGRIIISSDGNEHDEDDWAATPMSLALLAAYGLQDRVMVYSFSDHTWGSNKEKPGADAQMRESAFMGAKWFSTKKTKFIEAVAAPFQVVVEIGRELRVVLDDQDPHGRRGALPAPPEYGGRGRLVRLGSAEGARRLAAGPGHVRAEDVGRDARSQQQVLHELGIELALGDVDRCHGASLFSPRH